MFLHSWTVFEDITVCSYAMARRTDPKSVSKLSLYLGISENRIRYRLADFTKLVQGKKDWHYSRQERKVFDWLNRYATARTLTITPTK